MKPCTSLLIIISLFSAVAFAEIKESSTFPNLRSTTGRAESQPHAGLLVGYNDPNEGDNTGALGVDVGYQPYIPFGLGFEFTNTDNRSLVLGKLSYNFGGELPIIHNSFVGMAAGQDGSTFVIGPLVGFDIPIASQSPDSRFTLGGAAKYLFSDNSNAEALSFNGNMKYWF